MPPPIPLTSGEYVGQGGDIPPDLYGADAIQKGCSPGMYWDGWYQKCLPSARRPINPPPLPPTLDDWRKQQHVTGSGWDLFHDVFGSQNPFNPERQEHRWQHHHNIEEGREHEHHRPWHHEHWVGADVAEIVGAAVSDGAVAADNAAVQADSAQLAASHPDAKGTTAAQSAQAAASHATKAASHAQAAATHPSPEVAVAHAQKANQHAQQAAVHAANAHVACGNTTAVGAYYTGAEAGAQHQHPAVKAAAHADNAAKQASSAKAAASHPAGRKNPAVHEAAHAAASHATQAQRHAEAARAHPTAQGAEHHAREAMKHTNAAAAHAVRAHGEVRGHGREGFGRGREGLGRGRGGFGRGREAGLRGRGGIARGHEWFRRPEFAEYSRRYGEGWWRRPEFAEWGRQYGGFGWGRWGFGRHPAWQRGIGAQWMQYSAQCAGRDEDSGLCVKEMIVWPTGQTTFRITPAGEQLQFALAEEEQAANSQVQLQTGVAVPDADAGMLPGSEQTSDGSAAETADQVAADQVVQDATDETADQTDLTADTGSDDASTETATQGDFAGWDMAFTDPYGYFNMAVAPAWDSAYPYLPPDYPWYWR